MKFSNRNWIGKSIIIKNQIIMKICISGVAKFLTRDPLIKEEINLKIG